MNQPKKALQEFSQRYFGKKYTRFTKPQLTQRAATITNIIVDSANLTSGELSFDRAITFGDTTKDPLETARVALATHPASHLHTAIGTSTVASSPVEAIRERVQGTIWHHGETFIGAWIGKPTSIAHHANLTDNEREQLLLRSRELAAHGSQVYAVATSAHLVAPHSYKGARATVVGLLVFHPHIYPGTEAAVAALHAQGITITYASKDSEHVVQTLARTSLISSGTAVPFVFRPGRRVPEGEPLYASLSEKSYQSLIATFAPCTTVIVQEPLPSFWHAFSTFLR